MRIIPIRGLNLRCRGHVDPGIPVECEDKEARELLALNMVEVAPAEIEAEPIVETAVAPPAPETAIGPTARKRRRRS